MSEYQEQQYIPSMSSSPDIPLTETPPVWTSPSFWITLLPTISAVVGFFLHKQIDLSSQAAALGLIGASIASGLLAVSRSLRHKAVLEANTHAQALRLDQQAARRQVTHDQSVEAAFREVGYDMRVHGQRLAALEKAVRPKTIAKTAPAKKTTARKTTQR